MRTAQTAVWKAIFPLRWKYCSDWVNIFIQIPLSAVLSRSIWYFMAWHTNVAHNKRIVCFKKQWRCRCQTWTRILNTHHSHGLSSSSCRRSRTCRSSRICPCSSNGSTFCTVISHFWSLHTAFLARPSPT